MGAMGSMGVAPSGLRGHDGLALLRRDLQLRPLNLAGEVPRDAALRDGHDHFVERTGHHKISLARGIAELPGAPNHFEGAPTACTRFAGAHPTPIDVRAI